MQIRQQDHSIHVFDGIIEIIRTYDNRIVMSGVEDKKLLKLIVIHSIHRILQIWLSIIVIYLPTCYGMLDLVILIMIVLELWNRKEFKGFLLFQYNFPNVMLVF